jgi:hypothetical protein
MSGVVKNFFATGNTASGFVSLLDSALQGLDRIYILKGGPGTGKSDLIREIGNQMAEAGHDIWFIHCPSGINSLDGVVIPAIKVGIVDGSAPHVIEPRLPGAVEQIVNLGAAWSTAQLRSRKQEIESLNTQIQQNYERAYAGFAEALRIHDEWETIYIANMDFQKADELTESYVQILYGDQKLDKSSRIDHRFLGAATPAGAVDFIQNLTEGISKRYFIKGRPGSGKSTMLKKLAAAGSECGFDVEIYHCGFDSNSLDMIIVPELEFAMFDSTAPHEYFPVRDTDQIVDMYALCITEGTDEEHAEPLNEIKSRYSAKMKASTQYLAQAKSLYDELEQIYISSLDTNVAEMIKEEIKQEILG